MTELLIYLNGRSGGRAQLEVIADVPDGQEADPIEVEVEDNEPEDVVGLIVQRAVEEAGWDFYVEGWREVTGLSTPAFLVAVPEGVTRT